MAKIAFVVGSFFVVLLCLNLWLLLHVYDSAPDPYMDELFHVAQATRYFSGRYNEWDPMITTLPGLYFTSLTFVKPWSWALNTTTCSVIQLRCTNIIFGSGNFLLLWTLMDLIHKDEKGYSSWCGIVTAITLAVFPVLYFFTFLYYTDPGSTFFVLISYLFGIRQQHIIAAVFGSFAVLFRQTNIVWVAFICLCSICKCLLNIVQPTKRIDAKNDVDVLQCIWTWLINGLQRDFHSLKNFMLLTVCVIWPYLVVGISFALFVWSNGGIVVGAHHDHEASFHFPQLFYFVSFSLFFSCFHLMRSHMVYSFVDFIKKHLFSVAVLLALCIYLVWQFTYVHRYLLADNRHYTFYIWSKVFERYAVVRYLLVPCYIFAGYCVVCSLSGQHVLWRISYILSLCIALVPSALLELRYFIIPYLLLRLNMQCASLKRLTAELFLYSIINVITLYIFVYKPFQSQSEPGLQHFMW